MDFVPHQMIWTDKKVESFWNYQTSNDLFEDTWFTNQVGKGILNFSNKYLNNYNKILDYGTGRGHLLNYFLKETHCEVMGCDFSKDSITFVNEKFSQYKKYKGSVYIEKLPSSLPNNFFDVVYLIEAIEHLTEKFIDTTLSEISRVLKTNGKIVISTPNDEALERQKVLCPECGSIFHRVQHVRSFNVDSLNSLMETNGFTKLFCGATNLENYNSNNIKSIIKRNLTILNKKKYINPHLMYIGRKDLK